jgi:peptidoglycan/LPS O-acetylase OafA/YrhL
VKVFGAATTPNSTKLGHLPEIDGLRALAVLAVVFYHSRFGWFRGGYFGVDIFFVISGFVITRRVLSDLDTGQFSMAQFYRRRIRRILPALMLVLIVSTLLAHQWLLPSEYVSYSLTLKSVLTLNANHFLATQTNYFQPETDFMPLAHLWSLAIEEQFYLVFPLVVFLAISRGRLLAILVGVTVASVIWMLRSPSSESTSYFSTLNRVAQITIGGICALKSDANRNTSNESRCKQFLNASSLILILALVPVFSVNQAVPNSWSLLPVSLAAVFILTPRSGLIIKILSWRPLQVIGLSSFSIYLFHQPLMSFARTVIYGTPYSFPTASEKVAMCVASAILGLCSWRLIEEPTRRSRSWREGIVAVVTLALGLLLFGHANHVIENQGLANRIPAEFAESIRRREEAMNSNGVQISSQCVYSVTLNEFVGFQTSDQTASCLKEFGSPILVVGDSHAEDLHNALALNLPDRFIVGMYRNELTHAQFMMELAQKLRISALRPHAIVFTLEASTWIENNQVQTDSLESDAKVILSAAGQIAENNTFVWLGPQLEPRVDLFGINPLVGRLRDQNTIRLSEQLSVAVDERLRVLAEAAGIRYISKLAIVDFEYSRDFEVEQGFTYSDRTHWSTLGEQVFGARLVQSPLLKSILD